MLRLASSNGIDGHSQLAWQIIRLLVNIVAFLEPVQTLKLLFIFFNWTQRNAFMSYVILKVVYPNIIDIIFDSKTCCLLYNEVLPYKKFQHRCGYG